MVAMLVRKEINSSKMNFVVLSENYGGIFSKTRCRRTVGGSPSEGLNLSQGVNDLVAISNAFDS